jgi:hypothetical protein
VQVESLERKKDQVDYVTSQMIEKWRFTRRDQTILQAAPTSAIISRWSGSSTWEGKRWIRDETRPETLDYYVATVPFHAVTSPSEVRPLPTPKSDPQLGPMPNATILQHMNPYLPVARLERARVPPGASADEVFAYLDELNRREQETLLGAQMMNMEAQHRRQQQRQATRSSRSGARRARATAEVASAYPHHLAGGADGPARVTADTLRAARAVRRLRRGNDGAGSTETMDGVVHLFGGNGEEGDADTAMAMGDAGEGSSARAVP